MSQGGITSIRNVIGIPVTVPNGGTGDATLTAHALLVGEGTSPVAFVGPSATAGQVLQSAGAAADPVFSTATYPATAGTAGKILRSDGTNIVSSTSTFADTYGASTILYSNGANTVAGLATANSAALVTTSAGVPVMTGTMTNGQTILGVTSGTPVVGTITGSNGITVTAGSGTLALSGKVVQTVYGNNIGNSSTTSTTLVDVTGGSLSITPTSASNKILCIFSWASFSNTVGGINGVYLPGFFRGATQINAVSTMQVQAPSGAGGVGNWDISHYSIVDSPATTSATTYKMQHRTNNAAVSAGTSELTIILMEIVA